MGQTLMYEYTLATLVMLAVIIVLDRWLLRTRIISIRNTRLWKTTAVFGIFQLVLDNYFSSIGLWIFDPRRVLGIYVPVIPIENLVFGMELLWMCILLYTFFTSKSR